MTHIGEIAQKLVDHCRAGTELEGLDTIYDPDCLSVEATGGGGMPREFAGIDAIKAKHAWGGENYDVHDSSTDGPYLHGDDQFGVIFFMDVTEKATGERSRMQEVAIYTVADGKIVKEQFFMPPMPG